MKNRIRQFTLVLAMLLSVTTYAGNSKKISFSQLPATAQQTVKKNFPKQKIAVVKMETEAFRKSYEVIFHNGNKIEFDKNGKWKEIDCKHYGVPAQLVPTAIGKYVRTHYPKTAIKEISRKRYGYEVELSNKMELKFNKAFQLIDIDR